MSPEIFRMQLDAGAWGITAATPWQVLAMRRLAIAKILLANVLVDRSSIRAIAQEMHDDPTFQFLCYVDSVQGATQLSKHLEESGTLRPIEVLIEVGYEAGRTGVRNLAEALDIAQTVRASPNLTLAGIAGFEGLIAVGSDARDKTIGRVDDFLNHMVRVAQQLDTSGLFAPNDQIVITAGGSAYFDRVVQAFSRLRLSRPVDTVLRSGCYVTHDHGWYDDTSPLGRNQARDETLDFKPALEIWTRVWSRPEPTLAIVGMGKRDVGCDVEMPKPLRVYSPDGTQRHVDTTTITVTRLDDQHAHVQIAPDLDLQPGDQVAFGVSHPCTTFDKWKAIALIDETNAVLGAISTHF